MINSWGVAVQWVSRRLLFLLTIKNIISTVEKVDLVERVDLVEGRLLFLLLLDEDNTFQSLLILPFFFLYNI